MKIQIESNGWHCQHCNGYNDILQHRCIYCYAGKPFALRDLSIAVLHNRQGEHMSEDKIELHKKLFAEEAILIKDMDNEQLRLRRDEFASILFEARVRLNSMDHEERTRKDKGSWLVSSDESVIVSDSIRGVKEREKRKTKFDKLREDMKSLGIADADILIGQAEKKAIAKNVDTITFNSATPKSQHYIGATSELCRINRHSECTSRFTDSNGSHECKCNCHQILEPFNPNKLFS